jgi:hypothetical protein
MSDGWFGRRADPFSKLGQPNRRLPARKYSRQRSFEGLARERRGKPGRPRRFQSCRGGATGLPTRQTGRAAKRRRQLVAGCGQTREWVLISTTIQVPVHQHPSLSALDSPHPDLVAKQGERKFGWMALRTPSPSQEEWVLPEFLRGARLVAAAHWSDGFPILAVKSDQE